LAVFAAETLNCYDETAAVAALHPRSLKTTGAGLSGSRKKVNRPDPRNVMTLSLPCNLYAALAIASFLLACAVEAVLLNEAQSTPSFPSDYVVF
jgi:hypothetical protein